MIHTPISQSNEPALAATSAGDLKMPAPMTMAMASMTR